MATICFIVPATLAAAVLLSSPIVKADCLGDVAKAYGRANALPPSDGRGALLEQIQRAEIAHHEGDEEECQSAVADATDVLNSLKSPQ